MSLDRAINILVTITLIIPYGVLMRYGLNAAASWPEPLRTLSARFEGNFGVYCSVPRAGRLRRGEVRA